MKPIRAPPAAMRMSIGSVSVMPTPTAGPLIAAIEGLRQLKIASTKPLPERALSRPPVANTPAPSSADVSKARGAGGDVRAAQNRAARAGHDDGANVVVGVGAKRVLELRAHGAGIGVQLVGPVERDRHDRIVDLAGDLAVGCGRLVHVEFPSIAAGPRQVFCRQRPVPIKPAVPAA